MIIVQTFAHNEARAQLRHYARWTLRAVVRAAAAHEGVSERTICTILTRSPPVRVKRAHVIGFLKNIFAFGICRILCISK